MAIDLVARRFARLEETQRETREPLESIA